MRRLAVVMFIAASAALCSCSDAAKSKVDAVLRSAPASDGKIVARIPQGSSVRVSKCSHGWCEVSWQGKSGFALAKNFSAEASPNNAAEPEADDDEMRQSNDGADDEGR